MSTVDHPPIDNGARPAPIQPYAFKDYNPNISIFYIRSIEQAKTVLDTFPPSGPLGFDLEWRPTYRKGAPENPVALIQLANDHVIMLFQVSCMHLFPSELKQILENPHIAKAGVGIQGDARKLFRDCSVSMRNCVDLSLLARTVDNPQWTGKYNSPIGLARLIECYEYKLLLKGKVSRSDWTAALNSKQQEYAGNDAHAGYTLFKKLEAMMSLMPSLPKAAWYTFHVREGILCNDDGYLWEAENPHYDPGILPEPNPPTEAQLRRKQKQAEVRAAQKATASSWLQGVGSWIPPVFEPPHPSTIYPLENPTFSPQAAFFASNSMPSRNASGFEMKQVSGYQHPAGMQTIGRNNQDPRFQSNRSGPVSYRSRSFGTGKKRGDYRLLAADHCNLGPSPRANP